MIGARCTRRIRTAVTHALVLVTVVTLSHAASADTAQRSWQSLTTGNGHGFQVFDTSANKIVTFLDHPYRYVGPPSGDPKSDGPSRRNLAYDFFFGVRGGGAAGWLNAPSSAGDPEYLEDSNIIRVPATLGGVNAESFFFAPFGYEGNAVVALLKAPGATDGFALFNFHMGGGLADSPDSNGEATRAVPGVDAVVETGPGGGAMVYVALSTLDHEDCAGVFGKVRAGQDLASSAACSGNDRKWWRSRLRWG